MPGFAFHRPDDAIQLLYVKPACRRHTQPSGALCEVGAAFAEAHGRMWPAGLPAAVSKAPTSLRGALMLAKWAHTVRGRIWPTLTAETVRLVIITKNSAAWIGEILDVYARLAVSPKVLLDGYSTDATETILRQRGTDYEKIWPELPRVEAAIGLIGDHVDSPWVFRVDDDELPSRSLLQWIARKLASVESPIVGVPRRWLRLIDGYCEYSNHPLLAYYGDAMDAQWRLFQPGRVRYTNHIHTPGFIVEDAAVAPNAAYLAHFDWIIRSRESRLSKIRGYDLQTEGAGSFFRELYVWEDSDLHAHGFRRLETREFDRIARRLRRTQTRASGL